MLAAIFDLDGTMIDLFDTHLKAFQKVINDQFNLEFTSKDLMRGYGLRAEQIMQEFFEDKHVEADYESLATKRSKIVDGSLGEGVRPLPGVLNLLEELKENKIKISTGTSCRKNTTQSILKAAGLFEYFDIIVTIDDVSKGKPEPDIFLKAADKMGVNPSECIVFEDSPYGIDAAKKANMKVVAVTTGNYAKDELQSHNPDAIFDNLEDVNFNLLASLF